MILVYVKFFMIGYNMTKNEPLHPGQSIRNEILPSLKLSVTEASEQLGVTRESLSRLLSGRAALSTTMALNIEKWLGVERGGEAKLWLKKQIIYNLWHTKKSFNAAQMVLPVSVDERYTLKRSAQNTHPGLALKEYMAFSIRFPPTYAALELGVERNTLIRVLTGRASISTMMALRIEAWLGVSRGGEAQLWLEEQSNFFLWKANKFLLSTLECSTCPIVQTSTVMSDDIFHA
jgi:addiction module HigA family antidote